jgi:uncharacterized protein (TIGR02996 family)
MTKLNKTYLMVLTPDTFAVPHRMGGGEAQLSDAEYEEIYGTREKPNLTWSERHLVFAPSDQVPKLATLTRIVASAGHTIYAEGVCLVTVTKHVRRGETRWAGVVPFERPLRKPKTRDVEALKKEFARYVRSNPKGLRIHNEQHTLKRIKAAPDSDDVALWILTLAPLPKEERMRLVALSTADIVSGLRTWLNSPDRKDEIKRVRPLTAEDRSFFHAIVSAPDDDTPRLIYADWLQDRDDPRGEFIRLQCQLARIKYNGRPNKRRDQLQERVNELLAEYGKMWLAPLQMRHWRFHFERGFPIPQSLTIGEFLKDGQQVFDACPIQVLRLMNLCDYATRYKQLEAVVASPLLDRVLGLAFTIEGVVDRRIDDDATGLGIGDLGALILTESPRLAHLTYLELRENEIGDAGVRLLAASRHLSSLVELDLSSNPVSIEGARALAASKTLVNLTKLHMRGTEIGAAGARLLRERFGHCAR